MSLNHFKKLALALTLLLLGATQVRATTRTVTNTNDSGPGSLRQAVSDSFFGDTIQFDLPAPGPWTITLTSGQLMVLNPLTITGPTTAPLTISGNDADRVFLVRNTGGLTLQNLIISQGNESTLNNDGGGICNLGTLALTNCTVTNCRLSGSAYTRSGGGIFNSGSMTLNNCTLINNPGGYSATGGGFYNSGQATINNCLLYNNTTNGAGGGFYNTGTVALTNSTLAGNGAPVGGGLFNTGTTTISNCTLVNNSGLRNEGVFNSKNSIIANNSFYNSNTSAFNTRGVNYATDDTCPGFIQVASDQINLDALAENGGPTQTMALLPGSVAIDAATDGTDWFNNPLTADQRGLLRPARAAYDVGAYEFQNHTPVADAGVDQTVNVPHDGDPFTNTAAITLDGSASSDPDGDTLTYQWTDQNNNAVGTTATPTVNLTPGTYTFTLAVTDTYGALSASDSVTVTVNPEPNQDPTADAGQDREILTRDYVTQVQLDGSGSSDPDGDTLDYFWTGPDGTPVGNTANPTLNVVRGVNTFTLYVADPYNATYVSSDTVTITVTPPNQAPIAQDDTAFTVRNRAVTIPVIANDSDPDGDSFSIPSATTPAHGTADINHDGTITYTPAADYTGSDSFSYTLQDSFGATATATVTITISDGSTRITVANNQGQQFSGVPGQTLYLKGNLRRVSDNTGLPGRTLIFSVDGLRVGTAITGIGSAWLNGYKIPTDMAPGVHTVTVEFTGDGIYAPSSGSGTLTIGKGNTRVYVYNNQGQQFSGSPGQTIYLKGSLKRTSDNTGLPGRTLTFKVDGVVVGTATTGIGSAWLNGFKIPETMSAGVHTVTVEFAGDDTYNGSVGTGTLTVQ